MTTLQERPAAVRRPQVRPLASVPRREPDEPLRDRGWALAELMGRRPDLHDVYPPATIAVDAVLWSV